MKSILSKMVSISKSIGFMEFDGKNDHFKYRYVSAAAMLKRLNAELVERNVLCYACDEDIRENADGTYTSKIKLKFVCAETGEFVIAVGCGSGKDKGDKGVMKASTAAIKYAFAHAFTLGWGAEDPEDSKTDASKLPDPKKVKSAIDKAKTMATLEKQRSEIRMLRKDDSYTSLIAAFKKKKEELENG